MIAADFLCRPTVAEIVQGERFAGHVVRTLQRIRMTVVGEVCRTEDHHPIENWQYLGFATGHIAIPQLQMSAPFLAPVLVEVEEEIQAPVQVVGPVPVEVGMNSQLTTAHDLMESASVKSRIGDQIRNSSNRA